jgi:hypothetical protein
MTNGVVTFAAVCQFLLQEFMMSRDAILYHNHLIPWILGSYEFARRSGQVLRPVVKVESN